MAEMLLEGVRREFDFAERHFDFISKRVYKHAGIRLPAAKREMVYARLARRLRALGITTFDDYMKLVEEAPGEWEQCLNALTTNVTAFFREAHHFQSLAKLAQESAEPGRPFRIWSAGCSSGEEPYSIAITLAETLGLQTFEVLASDIDTQMISAGRRAIYSAESVTVLSPARQRSFFQRGTADNEGKARVRPELSCHVKFQQLNLMDAHWQVPGGLDAIFCRNVMIYFDKPTQERLVARFAQLLAPHGIFFAGHAESLLDKGRYFTMLGQTVYKLSRGSDAA